MLAVDADLTARIEALEANILSNIEYGTGWLSGGLITINADTSKIDYTSGTGIIVDASDPTNITKTDVSWTGATAVSLTYLSTHGASFLAIDENGDLVQSATFPAGGALRQYIQLGGVLHGNNTSITATTDFTSAVPFQIAPTLTDVQVALGVVNLSGNVFAGSDTGNLKFKKDAGSMMYLGIETKTDTIDPNNIINPALTEPDITFSWKDGSGGFNTKVTDAVTAGVYDDGTGGASDPTGTVSTNSWVNLRIHYSPDLASTIIQWGETVHNTADDAIAGINADSFGNNPSYAGVPVRGYLTLRGAATNMTLTSDAVFTAANKFGLV